MRAFHKLLSIYVFSYFPFGFEGRIWDLIVSVPNHCLSFDFEMQLTVSGVFLSIVYAFLTAPEDIYMTAM